MLIEKGTDLINKIGKSNRKSVLFLIIFALGTIILWQIPGGSWILYPFTILGTWFHEMGHGLTALLLGGNFHHLEIYSNGSGLAVHSGDLFLGGIGTAIVAAGGPLGPTIAGALFIGLSKNPKTAKIILLVLGIILLLSVLIWIRSIFGVIFITFFGFLVIAIAIKFKDKYKTLTLQLFGVQSCVSVYLSIGYLFSSGANVEGNSYLSDTAVMASYLFLPYWVWGALIILISIFLIYKSIKFAYK